MVYGRRHRETLLTFLHSGKLWHDALVLIDEESGSLWSQAMGRAIAGSTMYWFVWSAIHPNSRILETVDAVH